jgi:dihydrofolate reductase
MRLLRIIEHISLDGVIQHSADDTGFAYGDWTVPYRTPAGREEVVAAHGDDFDLLLGRRTYDLWSGFWPGAPASPLGERINAATKYVATHRPASLGWGPSEAIGPDLVGDIARIKAQSTRDLVLSGSSTLTSPLLAHGLVDALLLIVYPVLLGTGKRIVADATPARGFTLASSKALASGVILNRYVAAGVLEPHGG